MNPDNLYDLSLSDFSEEIKQYSFDQLYSLVTFSSPLPFYLQDKEAEYFSLFFAFQKIKNGFRAILQLYKGILKTWDALTYPKNSEEAVKMFKVISLCLRDRVGLLGTESLRWSEILSIFAAIARHCALSEKSEVEFRVEFVKKFSELINLSNSPDSVSLFILHKMCSQPDGKFECYYITCLFCRLASDFLPKDDSQQTISKFMAKNLPYLPSPPPKDSLRLLTASRHMARLLTSEMCRLLVVPILCQAIMTNFFNVYQIFISIVPHLPWDKMSITLICESLLDKIVSSGPDTRQQVVMAFRAVMTGQTDSDVILVAIIQLVQRYMVLTNDVLKRECVVECIGHSAGKTAIPAQFGVDFQESVVDLFNSTNSPRILQSLVSACTSWVDQLSQTESFLPFTKFLLSEETRKLWPIPGFTRLLSLSVKLLYAESGDQLGNLPSFVDRYLKNSADVVSNLHMVDMICAVGVVDVSAVLRSSVLIDKSICPFSRDEIKILYGIVCICLNICEHQHLANFCRPFVIIHFHKMFVWDRRTSFNNDECLGHLLDLVFSIIDDCDGFLQNKRNLALCCPLKPSRFRQIFRALFINVEHSRMLEYIPKIILKLTHPLIYNVSYIKSNFSVSSIPPNIYAELVSTNQENEAVINLSKYLISFYEPFSEFGQIILTNFMTSTKAALAESVTTTEFLTMEAADKGVLYDKSLLEVFREENIKARRRSAEEILLPKIYEGVEMTERQFAKTQEKLKKEREISLRLHRLIDQPNWLSSILAVLRGCFISSNNFIQLVSHSDDLLRVKLTFSCGSQLVRSLVGFAFPHLSQENIEVVVSCRTSLVHYCVEDKIIESVNILAGGDKLFTRIEDKKELLCLQISFVSFFAKSVLSCRHCRGINYSLPFLFSQPMNCLISLIDQIKHSLDDSDLVELLPISVMIDLGVVLITDIGDMIGIAGRLFELVSFFCELKRSCPDDVKLLCDHLIRDNKNHLLRSSLLETLHKMPIALRSALKENRELLDKFMSTVITSMFWPGGDMICEMSEELINLTNCEMNNTILYSILDLCLSESPELREAASKGIAFCFKRLRGLSIIYVIEEVKNKYNQYLPSTQKSGDLAKQGDMWWPRLGTGLALEELAPFYGNSSGILMDVLRFIMSSVIDDQDQNVVNFYYNLSIMLAERYGKMHARGLLPVFERILNDAPPGCHMKRHALVTIMGTLAPHLDKNSKRMCSMLDKLIETLMTPSPMIQENVARCLPTFAKTIKSKEKTFIMKMITGLEHSKDYIERRGFAYGLAGFCKGLGLVAIKKYRILDFLNRNFASRDFVCRENCALVIEALCKVMSTTFEPHMIEFIPNLLNLFGDQSNDVRKAADDCAKVIMSNLSQPGMENILPKLLDTLNDRSWRTRACAIDILGWIAHSSKEAMAHALPNVIPKLLEALNDVTEHIRERSTAALYRIGSVIKNQEIIEIIDLLIAALVNPKKTLEALDSLFRLKFVHTLDTACLSIIIPVIQLGFKENSTKCSFLSALIFSRLASSADENDLRLYTPQVIPNLTLSLRSLDSDVRLITAHAFSTVAKTIESQSVDDTLDWLYRVLTSEESTTDRYGAANGYFEIVRALGRDKICATFEMIDRELETNSDPLSQEGCLLLTIHMIAHYPTEFGPHIKSFLSSLLKMFSTDRAELKKTSQKVLNNIIYHYWSSSLEEMIPQMEVAILTESGNVRVGTLVLLGRLFCCLIRFVPSMWGTPELFDLVVSSKSSFELLSNRLGSDVFMRILSIIYLNRFDSSSQVSHTARQMWRIIVPDTIETVKAILSALYDLITEASTTESLSFMGNMIRNCLGDICHKMNKTKYNLISGLLDGRFYHKRGVLRLAEHIISMSSPEQNVLMAEDVVEVIKMNFDCESVVGVLSSLCESIGILGLNPLLPWLVHLAVSSNSDSAYRTLGQLGLLNRCVIPHFVLPQMCQDGPNLKALLSLSAYIPINFGPRCPEVIRAIMEEVVSADDPILTLLPYERMLRCVDDHSTARCLLDFIISSVDRQQFPKPMICHLIDALSACPGYDNRFFLCTFSILMDFLGDCDPFLMKNSWVSIKNLIKATSTETLHRILPVLSNYLATKIRKFPQRTFPGFCLPYKGIDCFLVLFQSIFLDRSGAHYHQGLKILRTITLKTSPASLRQSLPQLVRPILYAMEKCLSAEDKRDLVDSLRKIIKQVSVEYLYPDIRPVLMRAIQDKRVVVRQAASKCVIVAYSKDPSPAIFSKMIFNSFVKNSSLNIRASIMPVMSYIFRKKFPHEALHFIKKFLDPCKLEYGHAIRLRAAKCIGVFFRNIPESRYPNMAKIYLLSNTCGVASGSTGDFKFSALYWTMVSDMDRIGRYLKEILNAVYMAAEPDGDIELAKIAGSMVGIIFGYMCKENIPFDVEFFEVIFNSLNSPSMCVRRNTLRGLGIVLRRCVSPLHVTLQIIPYITIHTTFSCPRVCNHARRILLSLVTPPERFIEVMDYFKGSPTEKALMRFFPKLFVK